MKNKIYFIGNEELKERLGESLQLIGWSLLEFCSWQTGQTIIYQLEKVEELNCHIPDNLLIVTANPRLKESHPESVFKYDEMTDIGFSFARFILERSKEWKDSQRDFYDNREKVAILYLSTHKELGKLMDFLKKDRHFLFQKKAYNRARAEQPLRTLIYLEAPEMPSFLIYGLPLICRGYEREQKKELKKKYPSVPIIFINKADPYSIRRIRRLLY